jgi:hypothetical protein
LAAIAGAALRSCWHPAKTHAATQSSAPSQVEKIDRDRSADLKFCVRGGEAEQ